MNSRVTRSGGRPRRCGVAPQLLPDFADAVDLAVLSPLAADVVARSLVPPASAPAGSSGRPQAAPARPRWDATKSPQEMISRGSCRAAVTRLDVSLRRR